MFYGRFDSIYKKVRLSDQHLDVIKELFLKHFLKGDQLWIFGSRTDLRKKGGDIDFYIETYVKTRDEALKMKLNFIWALEQKIGEQKVDLVLNMLNFPYPLAIHQIAQKEGVKII